MCGLVGMMGDLSIKNKEVMKDLLYLDTFRGQDSTGLCAVHNGGKQVTTRKATMAGYDFINNNYYTDTMRFDDCLWMGHNRYKTTGSVSRRNAHPFEVLDDEGYITLVGAHNGTLTNKYDVEQALGDGVRYGTDSEALMNLIDKVGVKDAIAEASGAWSIVFWTPKDHTLNFIRNDQRPMYLAYTEDKKILLWASEPWMLYAVAYRHNLKLFAEDNKAPVFGTLPDTLYQWKVPARGAVIQPCEKEGGLLGKPEKKTFQGGTYGSWRGDEFWERVEKGSQGSSQGGTQNKAGGTPPKAGSDKQLTSNVLTMGSAKTVVGFRGKLISEAERDGIRKNGCGWCDGQIKDKDFPFIGETTGICGTCKTGHKAVIDNEIVVTVSNQKRSAK